jgi:hypothetical protein
MCLSQLYDNQRCDDISRDYSPPHQLSNALKKSCVTSTNIPEIILTGNYFYSIFIYGKMVIFMVFGKSEDSDKLDFFINYFVLVIFFEFHQSKLKLTTFSNRLNFFQMQKIASQPIFVLNI